MKTYNLPTKKQLRALCERPVLSQQVLESTIEAIYKRVAKTGDRALLAYTRQFDDVVLQSVVVTQKLLAQQAARVLPELKAAIDAAITNIAIFHQAQKLKPASVKTARGVTCWQEARAIERVGLYVPGGTAPLVSTVLMLGVPAQLAGCSDIIICTPPNKAGTIDPAICYAAQKIGVTKLALVGGAQAIAALARGTESVPRVDKIFGPGNQYVTAAKQYAQRFGVAIDMPAGPSEVMVIADKFANASYVAADLLSQAEHGADSQVVLVTTDKGIATAVNDEIKRQLGALPRRDIAAKALANSFCVIFSKLDSAFEFANGYAPEHLILNIKNSEKYIGDVINAGSVFLGTYSPESAGDYASGTNHTLPTGGWARSYGGVSLDSFVKKVTFQSLTKGGLAGLAPTIEILARAEGLEAHARAVTIRLEEK